MKKGSHRLPIAIVVVGASTAISCGAAVVSPALESGFVQVARLESPVLGSRDQVIQLYPTVSKHKPWSGSDQRTN